MQELRVKEPHKPRLIPSTGGVIFNNAVLAFSLVALLLLCCITGHCISFLIPDARPSEYAILGSFLSFVLLLSLLMLFHLTRPQYFGLSRRLNSLISAPRRRSRSHISHMRLDRFQRLPGYYSPYAYYPTRVDWRLLSFLHSLYQSIWHPNDSMDCDSPSISRQHIIWIHGVHSRPPIPFYYTTQTTVSELYDFVSSFVPLSSTQLFYLAWRRVNMYRSTSMMLSMLDLPIEAHMTMRLRVHGGASSRVKGRKRVSDVIEISSDSEDDIHASKRQRTDVIEISSASENDDHTLPRMVRPVKEEVIDVDIPSADSESHHHSRSTRLTTGKSSRTPSSSKRKLDTKRRRVHNGRPGKGKGRVADIDRSLQLTERLVVDTVEKISEAWEYWPVSDSDERVAYILDLRDDPACLEVKAATSAKSVGSSKGITVKHLTVDAFIKRECQDSWGGPTGSSSKLTAVYLLDPASEEGVKCRVSHLSCKGCYVCSSSDPDLLSGFERWSSTDQTQDDLFTNPVFEAHSRESTSKIARAQAFYRSVMGMKCTARSLNGEVCGGSAILRKFKKGTQAGKSLFVGCANWREDDKKAGIYHRFTAIRTDVSETLVQRLFAGDDLGTLTDEEEVKQMQEPCPKIAHPGHLPKDARCKLTHVDRDGRIVEGRYTLHDCPARLTIYVPEDVSDLRAVIVPKSGVAHNHPIFPAMKTPYAVAKKYKEAIRTFGPAGATTLRVDKAASTSTLLDGMLPQELHPSLINNRRRRDFLRESKLEISPQGRDVFGVLVQLQRSHEQQIPAKGRYIQSVTILSDSTHVVVTIEPKLAPLAHKARWIMVDTTFKVVHGKTNEWKLVIWSDELMKRVVIGRVWCNRATRTAFQRVWSDTFDAIREITGKALNFQIFSPKSRLLCAIGDSEGAQAQGFADTIISHRMHEFEGSVYVNMGVDELLMHLWKTCLVHFDRGILGIRAYISQDTFDYL
ncbi:hypothetical protein BDZ89DRAFT_1165024, partial [Hymenopellis radicata]